MERAPPVVHETVVDGVTTFWTDQPPPLTATLHFRVGFWDEALLDRGVTHLVEHLALFPLRDCETPHGGTVAGSYMAVQAEGSEAELVEFFRAFSSNLRSLPLDRLEKEAGVLLAEDAGRAITPDQSVLTEFFGPNGPGMATFSEHGLECLRESAIQAWADRHCVRENAVLTLTGPPPTSLGIDLPRGTYAPYVLPPPHLGYRPTRFERLGYEMAGIGLGALTLRTPESVLAMNILWRRLTARLRHDLGLVYGVGSVYYQLDADTAFGYLGTDIRPGHLRETVSAWMEVVRALADDDPTLEEVELQKRAIEKDQLRDPALLAGQELYRVAVWRLLDYEETTADELQAEQLRATPPSIGAAFRSMLERGGIAAPPDADVDLPPREVRDDEPVVGSSFYPRPASSSVIRRLILGEQGVSGQVSGCWTTRTWGGLVLAQQPEPYTWHLMFECGIQLQLGVRTWWRWRKLQRLLEKHIPPNVRLPEAALRHLVLDPRAAQERERMQNADDMVVALRKDGMSRNGVIEQLQERGFSRDEAEQAWERS